MTPPTQAGKQELLGRLKKAEEFAETAELVEAEALAGTGFADSFVSNAVTSGIASADVICIALLGQMSKTANHRDAVSLLEKADKSLAMKLRRLIALKSKAQYGAPTVSAAEVRTASVAHLDLLEAARLYSRKFLG